MGHLLTKYYRWRASKAKTSAKREEWLLKWYYRKFKKSTWNVIDITGLGWTMNDKRIVSDYYVGKGENRPVVDNHIDITFEQAADGLIYTYANGVRRSDDEWGMTPEQARQIIGDFKSWSS